MALSIKNDRADELARELASLTGESLTEAVVHPLEERLARQQAQRRRSRSVDDLVAQFAALPVLDHRCADEIIGYDEHGLPS